MRVIIISNKPKPTPVFRKNDKAVKRELFHFHACNSTRKVKTNDKNSI